MKALKTLVAIALSATGLGSAVTLGVVSNNAIKEAAAAATITSVTLKGSFDGWGSGVAFTKDGSGDYNLTYSLSTDVQFKILVQGGGDQWVVVVECHRTCIHLRQSISRHHVAT